jgi:CBS domain-containing membrane protein
MRQNATNLSLRRPWNAALIRPAIRVQTYAPGVGGAIAIGCVLWISRHFVGLNQASLLVASMGASAVLLFAMPDGPLSRPWSVFGGHVLSAFVGVTCAALIASPALAAATAVGMAILVMGVFNCTHPPGGATALSAVIGGSSTTSLGIHYVFTPVMLNAVIMIGVAWLFHLPTSRYPLRAARRASAEE